MTLEMTLSGQGVVPAVTSSHPGGLLDFGYVLEMESTSQVLKVSQQCANSKRTRRRTMRKRLHLVGFEDIFCLSMSNSSQFLKRPNPRVCWLLIFTDYLHAFDEVAALELTLSPVLPAAAEQLSGGSGFQGVAGQPLSLQASGWSWHGGRPAWQLQRPSSPAYCW